MSVLLRGIVLTILIALAGGLGFYIGLRKGADTMSTMASQNEVSSALSRIDSSIKALNKNDLEYSREQHQRDLSSALFDLGTYAPAVTYWQCKERDRSIVMGVKSYVGSHREMNGLPPDPLLNEALKFCQQ
jgi:hypothetical protein